MFLFDYFPFALMINILCPANKQVNGLWLHGPIRLTDSKLKVFHNFICYLGIIFFNTWFTDFC